MTRADRIHASRRLFGVIALLASGLLLISGCGTGPNAGKDPGAGAPQPETSTNSPGAPTPTPTPTPDPVVMTPNVKNGAKGVKVDTLVTVKATDGTMSKVTVSAPVKDSHTGKTSTIPVHGSFNKAKTTWTATDRLEPRAKYTVSMTGKSKHGVTASTNTTFTTQQLDLKTQETFPSITPVGDGPYGIAMPIIIHFDVAVSDHKNFEKHLKVTASPKQVGTWSWYNDHEVHYRPKHYWKPGSKITVEADLNGLSAGKGVYGQKSQKASFTIGRSIVDKVNLQSDQMRVYVNGHLSRTIPISAGKPGFTTRSGTKIVSQKLQKTKMRSETIGISKDDPDGYDLDVYWAMRITNSGEFLHAAPWNNGYMGVRNTSHGCTGMSTANARWLFGIQQIGDPVVTTGSSRGIEKGNGWTDFDVSYKEFAKGSAL